MGGWLFPTIARDDVTSAAARWESTLAEGGTYRLELGFALLEIRPVSVFGWGLG
jgi:hypothetical protein